MSGVAINKTLTLFQGALQHFIDAIDSKDVLVHICECFFTKTHFIEYEFKTQEKFDKFLKESRWNDLPSVNMFNFKKFDYYRDGKFYTFN